MNHERRTPLNISPVPAISNVQPMPPMPLCAHRGSARAGATGLQFLWTSDFSATETATGYHSSSQPALATSILVAVDEPSSSLSAAQFLPQGAGNWSPFNAI